MVNDINKLIINTINDVNTAYMAGFNANTGRDIKTMSLDEALGFLITRHSPEIVSQHLADLCPEVKP